MDAGEVKDLSGAWNDTDSQMVASEMMQDVLSRDWIGEFKGEQKRKPAVIVGEMRNLSHEHINVSTFVQELQRNMINSGKVKFVASSAERGEIRDERADCGYARQRSHPARLWRRRRRRFHVEGHDQYYH
jgi:hypothetical protein